MKAVSLNPAELISNLVKIGAIQIQPHDPFTFASGIKSPVYCDARLIISEPMLRDRIAQTFAEQIGNKYIDTETISGVATGSIAIASWTAEKLKLPMIYARKPKGYGHNKCYEGKLREGQKVVVIEDSISTGGNCLQAVEWLRESGATVLGVLVIYSHNLKKSHDNFAAAGVKYTALTTFEDLVEFAQRSKLVDLDGTKALLDWQSDPQNWGKE